MDDICTAQIILPRQIRCACHTLSLVATTDAKRAKETPAFERVNASVMSKCTALWNCSRRPHSSEIIVSILGHSLKTPCATRWNSLYDSIQALLSSKEKLRECCNKLKLQIFQERDFSFMTEYCDVLQPIASALSRLQAQSDCFYGELVPTLFTIRSRLEEKACMKYAYCKPLLLAVMDGFLRRFDDFLQVKLGAEDAVIAAVLHPYFKLRWLSGADPETYSHVQQLAEKAVLESLATASDIAGASPHPSTSATNASDEFFSFEQGECAVEPGYQEAEAKLAFLNYLRDPRHDISMIQSYQCLKAAFIRYNTPTCSSAPVERLFSFASLICRPHRSSISDRRFEQLLLLKSLK